MSMKNFSVSKTPNGYSLDIADFGKYLYFTERELFNGIFAHVGFGFSAGFGREQLNALVTAAENWNENKSAVNEILRLQDERDGMMRKVTRSEMAASDALEKYENLINELKKIASLHNATAEEYIDRIRDLTVKYKIKRKEAGDD